MRVLHSVEGEHMNPDHERILERLASSVVAMDAAGAAEGAWDALEARMDPVTALEIGLGAGMERVNTLFETHEYFIPELLLCSDAMYAGLEVLRPHFLKTRPGSLDHTVVIGVVEGDTHDIGKNIVATMLEAAGFNVVDLGRNVPTALFAESAHERAASAVALSTLMTSTMSRMGDVIRSLGGACPSIVGGAPVSGGFASTIGADAYARDAAGAVREIRRLVGVA